MSRPTTLLPPDEGPDRSAWPMAICLFVLTFAIFGRAAAFQFVAYDDFTYVVDNANVHHGLTTATVKWAATSVIFSNYIPLTLFTYLTVDHFFGAGPTAFHSLNILLHAVNVALVFIFLFRTGGRLWIAAFCAALWGWHPLRVESVAWVSELKDVLCGMFFLLTLLSYAQYVKSRSVFWYLTMLSAYTAALASKPMAVTTPFVLLLLDYYPYHRFSVASKRRKTIAVLIAEKVPLAGLAVVFSRVAIVAQRSTTQDFRLAVRLSNAIVSIADYLRDTLVPIRLAVFYPHPFLLGQPIDRVSVALSATVLGVLTGMAIAMAGRGSRGMIVGWIWFLGMLVPVVGLVQVGEQARADRYTYLPSIGLACLAAWMLSRGSPRQLRGAAVAVAPTLAMVLLVVEVSVTQCQLSTWRDSDTLFSHALLVTDSNYLAYGELANVRMHDHREAEALQLAERSLAIKPNSKYGLVTKALAIIHLDRYQEALDCLRKAIIVAPDDPVIRRYAGNVLVLLHKNRQAEQQFKRSISLKDDDPITHDDYAAMLANEKRVSEAAAQWRIALAVDPTYASAYAGLAQTSQIDGRLPDALREYKQAVRYSEPPVRRDWLLNLAWLEATNPESSDEEVSDALAHATAAVPAPEDAPAIDLDTLAAALARNGQFDRAVLIAKAGITKAEKAGNSPLQRSMSRRLQAYQGGHAYVTAQ